MAALSQTAASVLAGTGATQRKVTAGGTITAGMPVYKDEADSNKHKAARANAVGTANVAGIALCGASNGQPLVIQPPDDTPKLINLGAVLAVGESYYLSDAVAGQIIPGSDLGAGDVPHLLGIAQTASELLYQPSYAGVAKA